jgi:hypothetical protein
MDTFEYAVMRLYLETPEVKDKYYRDVKLLITTYDTSETGCPGREKTQKFDLNDKVPEVKRAFNERFSVESYYVSPNYPLVQMGPYLAMMGKEGWEVIEYKIPAYEDTCFGQALLKRRISHPKQPAS